MRRVLLGSLALALLGICLPGNSTQGQGGKKKQLLASTGWGSLSGKVTLDGKIPAIVDLTEKMKDHADKACCLDPKAKASEKIDSTWIVDPKTKGVANVMVWIKAPVGAYFPIHDKLKVRKEEVVIDQPHCAYEPRISAYQPYYYDGAKEVETGQKLIIRNSATVSHSARVLGGAKNPGWNKTIIPKGDLEVTFVPQPLPLSLDCAMHTWMAAKIFVFDHPYYAVTKEDGTFEIPFVPAGAEVTVMGWHEANGYAVKTTTDDKTTYGKKMTLKEGKNEFNFSIEAPK
jgi:hypothetical protein